MEFQIPRNQHAVQGIPVNKYLTRAEFPSAALGLFSATSPVLYSSTTGVFSFDTATTALTAYAQKANNLSDLSNAATARTNLGLVAGGAGDIWVEKAGDTMTSTLNITPGTDVNALTLRPFGTSTSIKTFDVLDSSGNSWFYIRKRLLSDANIGSEINFTTSGTTGVFRAGLVMSMAAGFTGSGFTGVLTFDNVVAGTNSTYTADGTLYSYRLDGNRGIGGYARAVTVGHNVGLLALAGNGNVNYGVWGSATVTKVSAVNVGVFANAYNATGTSPAYIGLYATVYNTASAPPNMAGVKTALLADNQAIACDIMIARDNGTQVFKIGDFGLFTSAQVAQTSGVLGYVSYTSAANTGRTASTEVINCNFNFTATQTWATGAITTQREFVVQAPTYAFVGASTITNAATWTITGAPVAGTNATITNGYAFWVQAGTSRYDGRYFGASAAATAANDLTLGAANQFLVSGNTQINAITTAGWVAGAEITLIFSGTPTVKHNTAGGAGTAVILLNGSADLVAAANTVLVIQYDGTQWQEVTRKIA